jgi:hypothetical protein
MKIKISMKRTMVLVILTERMAQYKRQILLQQN